MVDENIVRLAVLEMVVDEVWERDVETDAQIVDEVLTLKVFRPLADPD